MLSAARADSRGETVAGAVPTTENAGAVSAAAAVTAASVSVDTSGLTGVCRAAVWWVQAVPSHQRRCVAMPVVLVSTGSGYHPAGTRIAVVVLIVVPQVSGPPTGSCRPLDPLVDRCAAVYSGSTRRTIARSVGAVQL